MNYFIKLELVKQFRLQNQPLNKSKEFWVHLFDDKNFN